MGILLIAVICIIIGAILFKLFFNDYSTCLDSIGGLLIVIGGGILEDDIYFGAISFSIRNLYNGISFISKN